MQHMPKITLRNIDTKEIFKVIEVEKVNYVVLEISPSKLTSNANVKWLVTEFSRLFRPLSRRISFTGGKITITPEFDVWWEVCIHKGQIKFYLIVPDRENIKETIKRQVMKTWKQSNVKEVNDYLPEFSPEDTDITKLTLQHNPILSLDHTNPQYSPLDSFLNAKHYLMDDDIALLQIGMRPVGNEWNRQARDTYEVIKKNKSVPRKKGKAITKTELLQKFLYVIGLIAEEIVNLIGDFLIPGWQDDRTVANSMKEHVGSTDSISTKKKIKDDAFKTDIRVVAKSPDPDRRQSIIRAITSGFDPLEGDNKLIEQPVPERKKAKELKKVMERKMTVRLNGDILCSLELAKIINVPDQKAQIEHYNELSLVSHRGEAEVPKEIFEDDGSGIPFMLYEDSDGEYKTVYFNGKNKNLLCMPRVIIGEPGTGKTTFAQNFALDAFNRGYGVFLIDAADGKMVQRVLDRVKPDQRHKVKIIDFMNTDYPVGLGWNEIFRGRSMDVIEDLVVEEVITYIELVAGTELNMRAKQWVEAAVKAVFVTPDATLQDVENMLNNAEFRQKVIQTIEDPELRADWEYYHNKLKPEERKVIYDEAFRRLAPVMRKKALKNFILQRPKKDENGNYLFDIRKWMDEGYLVLIKANETLGETLQTALVSFVLSKFNLAMISREDIVNEDDRRPCFLILDEPDHYIKGSERWRNMLTRYRKYRCGLIFMFHGWQQLVEADKNLPKIIRKSGPHYIIFQTDEDNLLELKSVIEPDFKIKDIAKGMPQWHAVVKLKMFSKNGEAVPAFMAKSLGKTEERFKKYNNNDLYELCAKELGRPKEEVMEELFRNRKGSEFDITDLTKEVTTDGEGDLNIDGDELEDPVEEYKEEMVRKRLEYEVSQYFEQQIANGEEPDYELLLHMDELLEEG
jgi:hypothetical protein